MMTSGSFLFADLLEHDFRHGRNPAALQESSKLDVDDLFPVSGHARPGASMRRRRCREPEDSTGYLCTHSPREFGAGVRPASCGCSGARARAVSADQAGLFKQFVDNPRIVDEVAASN